MPGMTTRKARARARVKEEADPSGDDNQKYKSKKARAKYKSKNTRAKKQEQCALRTVASIVRFWGRIIGRDWWVLLRDLRFVLLGLEVGRKLVGLTAWWGEPLG